MPDEASIESTPAPNADPSGPGGPSTNDAAAQVAAAPSEPAKATPPGDAQRPPFRPPMPSAARTAPSATMSAAATKESADHRNELVEAAERAATSGDRSAVLTYLRLKRMFV